MSHYGQQTKFPYASPDSCGVPSVSDTHSAYLDDKYDPGAIPFPLNRTGPQEPKVSTEPWPTAATLVQSDQTSNADNDRNAVAPPTRNRPSPGGKLIQRSVGSVTAMKTGGDSVPYTNGFRPTVKPWVSPFQHQQQPLSDGGYIPMGHMPSWYTRYVLHPAVWKHQLQVTGISANYGGNIFLPSNQSANIPEELSTSLWLTNLPPDCTHQLLLGTIRGCGKIYAAVINPPIIRNDGFYNGAQHSTAASKLVFFDRAGLDKLMAKSQAGEFSVGGYVPRLRMNRIRSAPRPAGPQCRVLHIEGPSCIVNEDYLNHFFASKFKYELEMVLTLAEHGTHARQEWRFGSYRCQAESARQAIHREKLRYTLSEAEAQLWGQVQVHFGVDPCAQE
ncbi:hypothetical protein F4806DRAFT_302536 [Annulohypoxylon nitens]|nr:hypothetical protein F4806DRAFT_302536 [Annulohypoxylon nitens]